jgi:hypothetical protein
MKRPSPATAIALVALFLSLGGTTYAVTSLPRNSVGTAQLRDRAVTEDELANRAVITSKLATGAVRPRTIARGSIDGSRIRTDALGGGQIDEGLLGAVPLAQDAERAKLATRALSVDRVERAERADRATAADSAARADRASTADRADVAGVAQTLGAVDVNAENVTVPEGEARAVVVECDPGLVAIGGGFNQTGDNSDFAHISSSFSAEDAWVLLLVDDFILFSPEPITGRATAICIDSDVT